MFRTAFSGEFAVGTEEGRQTINRSVQTTERLQLVRNRMGGKFKRCSGTKQPRRQQHNCITVQVLGVQTATQKRFILMEDAVVTQRYFTLVRPTIAPPAAS